MRVAEIESWFSSHDDSEFVVMPADYSSTLIGNFATAQTILYTTKQHCLPRIKSLSQFPGPIATLARYGLPLVDDLPLLRQSSQSLIFIGDCDPPDLMIFAWLREHLPIVWHGVSDAFLMTHGTYQNSCIHIGMGEMERSACQYLPDFFPDFRDVVGPYCAGLLDDGFKIEVEGAIVELKR